MKKFLIEMSWFMFAWACFEVWDYVTSLTGDWIDLLWVIPLSIIPLTGVIVGIRKAFPNGVWGIK